MKDLHKKTQKFINFDGKTCQYYSLPELAGLLGVDLPRIPYSIRILLENCLRNLGQPGFDEKNVQDLLEWDPSPGSRRKPVPFMPARILMQDFTGLPVLNDLTALRAALKRSGKDPSQVNPVIPSDVVIDHSVQVYAYGCPEAQAINEKKEFDQNYERYQFLKWSEEAYWNLRVLPPGLGICHQVNLEYLGQVIFKNNDTNLIYPDTVLGTDSHTPMINGLGVLGWGVGGIEALAAMLGYPSEFPIPDVIGLHLFGSLPDDVTPTDLTLTLTSRLRDLGVVGKFVEVFGESVGQLPVETRAMIANMSPESGATSTYFPVDHQTIDYLIRTGRSEELARSAEKYFREQSLFRDDDNPLPVYSTVFDFDLDAVLPVLAGPKRPQDIFPVFQAPDVFTESLTSPVSHTGFGLKKKEKKISIQFRENQIEIFNGMVLIAAITSCTNTSDPSVMLGAALLARNAAKKGLKPKPWVKTSFAPGSRVVPEYLSKANLITPLQEIGFHVVGFGCTTCIGNSGPLDKAISKALVENDIVGAAVLSGNRNFESRIHPHIKANYLASPVTVIAYALAGRMDFDFNASPLGYDASGNPVYLRDILPDKEEIRQNIEKFISPEIYQENYSNLYEGNPRWNEMDIPDGLVFPWSNESTLIHEPDFLLKDDGRQQSTQDIVDAHVLAYLGDSVTTDHISPAGKIAPDNPAGKYLQSRGVQPGDFISFGARRGNDEVMVRGTFSNPRLQNKLTPDRSGGFTIYFPENTTMPIYDASQKYIQEDTPLVILAGKAYGTGSSRDWAAKGVYLQGVRAVIAESYERIHRTNLVCMGVLPLQFIKNQNATTLGLDGRERFTIKGLNEIRETGVRLAVLSVRPDGREINFEADIRIDTPLELSYFRAGGLARKVLADLKS